MHERALRRPDELRPAVVDVLAERRGGILYLSVYGEVDEVLELFLAETAAGLEGLVHYATELFDRVTIERFAANFASVLDAGSLEPDRARLAARARIN